MSSNDESDSDLACRFAMQAVEDRLRELTANLLRTIRGAGAPHKILSQAQALIEAAGSYREQVGDFPGPEAFGNVLDVDTPYEKLVHMGDEFEARVTARERIVRGALQIAASRLVEQRTQETAGNAEMDEGIKDLEAAREAGRKRAAQQQPPRHPSPSRRR